MKIERRFTSPNEDAYSSIEFTKTTSEIRNPDGTVVFHLADLEVPASWSQVYQPRKPRYARPDHAGRG